MLGFETRVGLSVGAWGGLRGAEGQRRPHAGARKEGPRPFAAGRHTRGAASQVQGDAQAGAREGGAAHVYQRPRHATACAC